MPIPRIMAAPMGRSTGPAPKAPVLPVTRIEVFGDKHAMGTMLAWAARAGRAYPAFEAMHQYILDVERELFDTEGASGAHGPWEPHEQQTRFGDNPIMQASGDLMRSLTDASDPHHHFFMTATGFAMGTDLEYGDIHQEGNDHVPQRRIVDFTAANRQVLLEMLSAWIVSAGLRPVKGVGWRMRGMRGGFIG